MMTKRQECNFALVEIGEVEKTGYIGETFDINGTIFTISVNVFLKKSACAKLVPIGILVVDCD